MIVMVLKKLIWVGSSKKDLITMPQAVVDSMGYGLYLVQKGLFPDNAKVLKGFTGAAVIELKESDAAGTYRVVYTTKMKDMLFVLHAFQKKSKQGVKTSREDIELIKRRLKDALEIYDELKMDNDEKK